jgi:serine/threonine-protein kinase
VLLALVLSAALVGGLATWLVTSTLSAAHQSPPAPASSSPAVPTVNVNSADLVGQQVSDVSQTLRNLGLTPVVTFTNGGQGGQDGQDPGTVVSVSPSGPVPVGSAVTVTVFQGHHHDQGNGGG